MIFSFLSSLPLVGQNLESETEIQKPVSTKQQNFGSKSLGQTDASLPKMVKVKELFILKHWQQLETTFFFF